MLCLTALRASRLLTQGGRIDTGCIALRAFILGACNKFDAKPTTTRSTGFSSTWVGILLITCINQLFPSSALRDDAVK